MECNNDSRNSLITNLKDAGCNEQIINDFLQFNNDKKIEEQL
ncbi:MAG: hypothetical protein ACK5LC_15385 [Coprobacillaceae bacterium]